MIPCLAVQKTQVFNLSLSHIFLSLNKHQFQFQNPIHHLHDNTGDGHQSNTTRNQPCDRYLGSERGPLSLHAQEDLRASKTPQQCSRQTVLLHFQNPTEPARDKRQVVQPPDPLNRPIPQRGATPQDDRRAQVALLGFLAVKNRGQRVDFKRLFQGVRATASRGQRMLLRKDLLRLENQIPYFVLEVLFDLTTLPEHKDNGKTLSLLALEFFNHHMQRPDHVIQNHQNLTGVHLLDLLRASVIPPGHDEPQRGNIIPTHTIHCVSKLRRAGIKLRPCEGESFLVIKFKRGVIEMPTITIDDFMSSFLLNCVAYEQCHKSCSKHITTYATLLDCLVNTYKDVEYLCDRNIIENCFGNDGDVARFVNNLGKDVAFDMDRCYLAKLFNDVHHYYGNSCHVQWASFKYTYFDTPWSCISAFAALILLIMTLLQTFYTVLGHYQT
ncbi:Plant protein of unknown function D [Prunus dulcis]|uniref:Transmembrane protein n=1 Tax=Prunus dulcis TaxID=3755 RepID=A0A4Y1RTM2_PRUDU|nr:Plant protein of unknown function D [Prunus dulcis]